MNKTNGSAWCKRLPCGTSPRPSTFNIARRAGAHAEDNPEEPCQLRIVCSAPVAVVGRATLNSGWGREGPARKTMNRTTHEQKVDPTQQDETISWWCNIFSINSPQLIGPALRLRIAGCGKLSWRTSWGGSPRQLEHTSAFTTSTGNTTTTTTTTNCSCV